MSETNLKCLISLKVNWFVQLHFRYFSIYEVLPQIYTFAIILEKTTSLRIIRPFLFSFNRYQLIYATNDEIILNMKSNI